MAKRAHKLEVARPPFTLIALSCDQDRHRLAWLLNSALSINLRESDSLPVASKCGTMALAFPTHSDDTTKPGVAYQLVCNRHQGQVLARRLPNVDYLLRVEGAASPSDIKGLLQAIRAIGEVRAALTVDQGLIKGLDWL